MLIGKNKLRMYKKALCLTFAFLLSIESFAAVVSDNDGSAFITKAEFDSLKNNFQSQINQYNTSIDSKIDGAIASYLAGITVAKQTKGKFFDGAGQKVVIINSEKLNNLKSGKPIIDWRWNANSSGAITDANNVARGTNPGITSVPLTYYDLHLKRGKSNALPYEIFFVDRNTNKLLYYTDTLYLTTNAVATWCSYGAWGTYIRNDDNVLVRWHAGPSGYTKGISDDIEAPLNGTRYDPRFGATAFLQIALSGLNATFFRNNNADPTWATSDPDATNRNLIIMTTSFRSCSVETDVDSESKILLINDFKAGDNSFKLGVISATNSEIDKLTLRDDIDDTYLDQVRESTLPPSDIAMSIKGFYIGNQGTASRVPLDNVGFFGSASWVNYGTSFSATGTVVTAPPWRELQFELSGDKLKDLKNNISTSLLDTYNEFGYKGYVYEGLPIDIFDKNCEVAFSLDLSTFDQPMYFALDTKPFGRDSLVNYAKTDDISSWSVDGVNVSNGSVELSNTTHKIKVELALDKKKVLFFKFGLDPTLSFNKREIFTLPKEYDLTTE